MSGDAVRRRNSPWAPAGESAGSRRPRCARPDMPGLQFEAGRVVRRDSREQSHERPAPNAAALRALHVHPGGSVRTIAGGAAAGLLVGLLVLAGGATAAAWIAIVIAVLAIVAGAVDYVRTHP